VEQKVNNNKINVRREGGLWNEILTFASFNVLVTISSTSFPVLTHRSVLRAADRNLDAKKSMGHR
jgi:hypothetical protein